MTENLNVFDFNLTKTEVEDIIKLENRRKKIDDKGSHIHPDYPFLESHEPVHRK